MSSSSTIGPSGRRERRCSNEIRIYVLESQAAKKRDSFHRAIREGVAAEKQKDTLPVEILRSLGEGVHRLLHLPPVCFVQDRVEDLLNSHRHLPAYLLYCSSVARVCAKRSFQNLGVWVSREHE